MIALLSGGDIDTIISAAASLFNVDVSEIEVRELFPAKIWIYAMKLSWTMSAWRPRP